MRWELEEPFNGQLCQEYLCQKSSNPLILLKVTIDNVGVPFYWDTVYMRQSHRGTGGANPNIWSAWFPQYVRPPKTSAQSRHYFITCVVTSAPAPGICSLSYCPPKNFFVYPCPSQKNLWLATCDVRAWLKRTEWNEKHGEGYWESWRGVIEGAIRGESLSISVVFRAHTKKRIVCKLSDDCGSKSWSRSPHHLSTSTPWSSGLQWNAGRHADQRPG